LLIEAVEVLTEYPEEDMLIKAETGRRRNVCINVEDLSSTDLLTAGSCFTFTGFDVFVAQIIRPALANRPFPQLRLFPGSFLIFGWLMYTHHTSQ
jgi:hypothetical protein